MPRPGVGNPGNRGGGRKSAYQEKADAQFLLDFFFKKHTKVELKEMLEKGHYSVSEVMLTKAYAGDMKAILAVFNKLFPDTLNVQGGLDFDFTDDRKQKN